MGCSLTKRLSQITPLSSERWWGTRSRSHLGGRPAQLHLISYHSHQPMPGMTACKALTSISWKGCSIRQWLMWFLKNWYGSQDWNVLSKCLLCSQTGIPLKTKNNPHGLFTELELFDMLETLVCLRILFYENSTETDAFAVYVRVSPYKLFPQLTSF